MVCKKFRHFLLFGTNVDFSLFFVCREGINSFFCTSGKTNKPKPREDKELPLTSFVVQKMRENHIVGINTYRATFPSWILNSIPLPCYFTLIFDEHILSWKMLNWSTKLNFPSQGVEMSLVSLFMGKCDEQPRGGPAGLTSPPPAPWFTLFTGLFLASLDFFIPFPWFVLIIFWRLWD